MMYCLHAGNKRNFQTDRGRRSYPTMDNMTSWGHMAVSRNVTPPGPLLTLSSRLTSSQILFEILYNGNMNQIFILTIPVLNQFLLNIYAIKKYSRPNIYI